MAQPMKSTANKGIDDTVVNSPMTNAQPNYYDTQVMFAGYPGSKTSAGSVRRSGRPVDPILDDIDELEADADVSALISINSDQE
jgi:hypothetical protein